MRELWYFAKTMSGNSIELMERHATAAGTRYPVYVF